MKVNTKHISLSVVLAIISFGIFAITVNLLSSNGAELQGSPLAILFSILSLCFGTFFLYFAKWLYDIDKSKQNLK
jgi:amino acid transporter